MLDSGKSHHHLDVGFLSSNRRHPDARHDTRATSPRAPARSDAREHSRLAGDRPFASPRAVRRVRRARVLLGRRQRQIVRSDGAWLGRDRHRPRASPRDQARFAENHGRRGRRSAAGGAPRRRAHRVRAGHRRVLRETHVSPISSQTRALHLRRRGGDRGATSLPIIEPPPVSARMQRVTGTAVVHLSRGAGTPERVDQLRRLVEARCPVANTLVAAGCELGVQWKLADR